MGVLSIVFLQCVKLCALKKKITRIFLFSGGHDTLPDSYCERNGNAKQFSTLSAAEESCLKDKNCIAVFDQCGKGDKFKLCSGPLSIVESSCHGRVQKSVLYLQHGKYVYRKLFYA